MRPHNHEAQNRFCEVQPCVILGGDNPCRSEQQRMTRPGTPTEDPPKKLREELQLLQHYESIVSTQVSRVIEVALETWGEAEKRAEATAAATERERERERERISGQRTDTIA